MKTAYRLAQRYSRQRLPNVDTKTMIVRPVWADPNVRNEASQAQIAQAHAALGVPQDVIWQDVLGYSPEQVAQFVEGQRQAEALKIATIAAQMRSLQTQQTQAAVPTAQPATVPATPEEQQETQP